MSDNLRQRYLEYIDVLNERRFEDLRDLVADELTYNDQPMTRSRYQRLLQEDVDAIPDLRFQVDLLVVEDSWVACRLDFDCTPEKPFLGFQPSGRRIRFAEHVFYRLSDGLIVAVTSLIDRAAIHEQTSAAR